jgi:hypothetical protein
MIDRCFDSRMQLNVQLMSEGPSRNSTVRRVKFTGLGFRRFSTMPFSVSLDFAPPMLIMKLSRFRPSRRLFAISAYHPPDTCGR